MRLNSGWRQQHGIGRMGRAWMASLGAAAALSGCVSFGLSPAASVNAPPALAPAPMASAALEVADASRRAQIRMELAASYLQAGQAQVALEEVSQALAATPDNPDAYVLKALVLMSLQDFAGAQVSLDRAMALRPGDPNTLHNQGWLQCLQGRYAEGVAVLDRVLQQPRYAEPSKTLMAKGMCLRQAGNSDAAEKMFFQAYEMDAGNPMIAYHLADLLSQRQQWERARFYIRRVNNSEYANAESLWLGIRVERALGDTAAVQQLASQLSRRFPGSKEWLRYEQGAFHG